MWVPCNYCPITIVFCCSFLECQFKCFRVLFNTFNSRIFLYWDTILVPSKFRIPSDFSNNLIRIINTSFNISNGVFKLGRTSQNKLSFCCNFSKIIVKNSLVRPNILSCHLVDDKCNCFRIWINKLVSVSCNQGLTIFGPSYIWSGISLHF